MPVDTNHTQYSDINHTQYIEMGASFQAVRPNCFIVPPGVIGKNGTPLDLIVTPTEKAQSYHLFCDALVQEYLSLAPILEDLPILTSLGSGLAPFAGARSRCHLCERHVLARLGLRTFIATFPDGYYSEDLHWRAIPPGPRCVRI
jgi:hypothetical protein